LLSRRFPLDVCREGGGWVIRYQSGCTPPNKGKKRKSNHLQTDAKPEQLERPSVLTGRGISRGKCTKLKKRAA